MVLDMPQNISIQYKRAGNGFLVVSTFKDNKMEAQDWVNVVLSAGGTIATAALGLLMSKFNKLEADNDSVAKAISDVKILIANDYVKKVELNQQLQDISKKLDKLEDLETQMATQYARKEDLKTLGESLGKKLDQILDKLERKADKTDWRGNG
jgi:DNA polymerase I-like protein with 3'-5' exonuclease and polymerase domains